MWRKREHHLLDIYKNSQSNNDSLLSKAISSAEKDKNCIYSCSTLSQSHPSLLLSSTKGNSTTINREKLLSKRHSMKKVMYQGNEFDVFGKEELQEHFAPLYSIEQFTPTKTAKERYIKGEILLRTEAEFKRGQIEAKIHNGSNVKRRRTLDSAADKEEITVIDGVFIKSTAPANTPAASIFFTDGTHHNEDEDLAYY